MVSFRGRAIFHSSLPRGYISHYTAWDKYCIFCVLVQEDDIEKVKFQYSMIKNDVKRKHRKIYNVQMAAMRGLLITGV